MTGADRKREDQGLWPCVDHQEVSSPPYAPHRLQTPHQKRRAGHLQDRP